MTAEMTLMDLLSNPAFNELYGVDFSTMFDAAVERYKGEHPVTMFSRALSDVKHEVLKRVPMVARFAIISSDLTAYGSGQLEAVNWRLVANMLEDGKEYDDFTAYEPITSRKSYHEAATKCFAAAQGEGAWQRRVCKDCGRVYYLTKAEMEDCLDKGLYLLIRCEACRKACGSENKKTIAQAAEPPRETKSSQQETTSAGAATKMEE